MYQHVDASHVKVDGRENKFITETKKTSPGEDHRENPEFLVHSDGSPCGHRQGRAPSVPYIESCRLRERKREEATWEAW